MTDESFGAGPARDGAFQDLDSPLRPSNAAKWRNLEPERGDPPLCEKCGECHYGRTHPFRALRKDRGEADVSDPATQGSAANLRYKVLGSAQESHHGGTGKWRKGQWRSVKGDLRPCANGIHFCRPDQLIRWLGPTIWLFEDGTPDETVDAGDKMVTRKGRVVERVETWNDCTARLFAADVAELALVYIPESRRDPFVRSINAARGFARGEISDKELDAAWAAAGGRCGGRCEGGRCVGRCEGRCGGGRCVGRCVGRCGGRSDDNLVRLPGRTPVVKAPDAATRSER